MQRFRMFRSGEFKIVRLNGGNGNYNIIDDPTELNNLAGAMPEKVKALSGSYSEFKTRTGLN